MNARVEIIQAYEENSALIAFADIVFSGGFLDGVKISGTTIWRAKGGGVTVLLPKCQVGVGSQELFQPDETSSTTGEQIIANLKNHVEEQYFNLIGSHVLPWICAPCGTRNGPLERSCTECGAKKVVQAKGGI